MEIGPITGQRREILIHLQDKEELKIRISIIQEIGTTVPTVSIRVTT